MLVKASGGTFVAYPTDATWKSSLKEAANWTRPTLNDAQWLAARVVGPLGQAKPWLDEVQMADGSGASRFKTTREFRVETAVPAEQTGSLLTMAFNEFGEIVASVEGGGLVLIRDANGDGVLDKPIELCDKVKNCQGHSAAERAALCRRRTGPEGSGASYRLTDSDSDGKPDEAKLLDQVQPASRTSTVRTPPMLGPDGFVYLVLGNHTKPETAAGRDKPLPRRDRRRFASLRAMRTRAATRPASRPPAASVIRTDTEGSFVETFAGGLRNATTSPSIARGSCSPTTATWSGTSGLPWYRPTRSTCSPPAPSAAGAAAGPCGLSIFLTACRAVLDTGRGSPTGVASYNHVMYPRRYHDALVRRRLGRRADSGGDACGHKAAAMSAEVGDVRRRSPAQRHRSGCRTRRCVCISAPAAAAPAGGIYRVVWNGKVPPR